MAENTYKTITKSSEGLFKDKGSKFIAYAYPVHSESEVKSYLEALRKEHHAARHHCWAYKIGNHGEQFRCSDDGEPSNSAGKPILGQLESFGVTNVLVVVVRYFGGILLGVGGLIQAYKEATKDALNNAEIVEKVIQSYFTVNFTYEQNNTVMNIIKRNKCEILSQSFMESCSLRCSVAQNLAAECVAALQKISEVSLENE
ncbi:MAG: YigZ family protein [Bacteroidales bacterium]|nr:YigZ family protein [Bacteroidales bacterium]